MESKKKVLFFMWSFSLGGGAEKILSTIVNNMDLDKYDIHILEMEHFDKPFEETPQGVKILKSLVHYKYPYILKSLLWRARIYFPGLVRKLLLKDNYDVEISFTVMNPPLQFSKRKEVKKIAWIHGSVENFLENKRNYDTQKNFLSNADHIVTISKKTRQSVEELFPKYKHKIVTIYNGYDFNSIIERSNEYLQYKIYDKSICVIGRIEKNKGSDRVLDIFRCVHKKDNSVHLYYIGAGNLEEYLKNKVKEYNLEENVHFLGYKTNPLKYLKNMKCLLSMSKQEGFPGVVVEAITLGVPFVITDVGGAEELSENGKYGDVVSSDKEAIEKLLFRINGDKKNISTNEFRLKYTVSEQIRNLEEII